MSKRTGPVAGHSDPVAHILVRFCLTATTSTGKIGSTRTAAAVLMNKQQRQQQKWQEKRSTGINVMHRVNQIFAIKAKQSVQSGAAETRPTATSLKSNKQKTNCEPYSDDKTTRCRFS